MRKVFLLIIAVLSSTLLVAQEYKSKVLSRNGALYEGEWPSGYGVLYSYDDGLILGDFHKGKPHGQCVCYKPNGEVYCGDFKKGKATGNGKIYRDNGIVVAGGYKNGKYHGLDTIYRADGVMLVGEFNKGKLVSRVSDSRDNGIVFPKPEYPPVDLRGRQESFLKYLELMWDERNMMMAKNAGLSAPKFHGGGIEDFALWVNSQVVYPIADRASRVSRTVIVEFTVLRDGTVTDVHAIFGSDPVLNEAAVKAVSKSPNWTPGEQNGQKRSVRMSVAVNFSM
jgi:TonB family protein